MSTKNNTSTPTSTDNGNAPMPVPIKEKQKRVRTKKEIPLDDITAALFKLSLEDRIVIMGAIKKSIAEEKKVLEEKLKLIDTPQ